MLNLLGEYSVPFDQLQYDHGDTPSTSIQKFGSLRVAGFPYCCGIRIVTDWLAVKDIKETSDLLLQQFMSDRPGILLWSGVPKPKDPNTFLDCADDQRTIDRLLANGWKIIQTFRSRMDGNYPVVLMCYNPHEAEFAE